MNTKVSDAPQATPDAVGTQVATIPVQLSTRFLEHFSEQLYSSPQKAFEELISNGWDAGASIVDVRVDADLQSPRAAMAVFDNGTSMDQDGLGDLWRIAFSPKEGRDTEHGRPLIGKFGIGKLATYVLAARLTYICKAADGVIRRVTMDYGEVDSQKSEARDSLINNLQLPVYEVAESDVEKVLDFVPGGLEILRLMEGGGAGLEEGGDAADLAAEYAQEFGGLPAELETSECDTWTLVVLSDLKPTGRELKLGILRRMLAAALPIGTEMCIRLNGDRLMSTKLAAPVLEEWVIGPDLDIGYVELVGEDADATGDASDLPSDGASDDEAEAEQSRVEIKVGTTPYPYVELPGVGRVTGLVRVYEERITGGKSEERGASNGFHVNVLGRVVNQSDPSFGEENLNHASWARFRMTVRADGLNELLTTSREQFKERRGLLVFRAFLRRVFNKARNVHDSDGNVVMPDGGDVLVRSLGVLSLSPLRSVVSETLRTQARVQRLFDETGIEDREAKRRSWREDTAENIKSALGEVRYEHLDDGSFVKFRIRDSAVVVNKEHPFVLEHTGSKAEKELVRTVAMIDVLADVYALDVGIEPSLLDNVRDYRDKLMRFRARQRRKSGVHIARLLQEMQHESTHWRRFERVVSDALRYLGFDVEDLGGPGEPEGIAKAFPLPNARGRTAETSRHPLYSFTFDAKSSKHSVVKTGNVSLDGVVEHRRHHDADHALVVGPGFSGGSLVDRCRTQGVTPMTATDLGKLLELTAEYGAISVTAMREVFSLFDPEDVSSWVLALESQLKTSQRFTIDVFIRALEELKGKVPDTLAPGLISYTCRESLGIVDVDETDVLSLVKGLEVIVPELVGIAPPDRVIVNASSSQVAAAIAAQLERLHGDGSSDAE